MFSTLEPQYQLNLEIAGISIAIHSFQKWADEPHFLPFVKETESPDYTVIFKQTESLPEIPEDVIHEDDCYRVHPNGECSFLRSFFDAPRDFSPYAVAKYDYAKGRIRIDCLPKGFHCMSELHNGFFHLGFEAMLIHRNRLCFHAACVDTPLGGLLFSGPSGIGKSTQAELWQQYRGAKQINGDRPILSREENGWLAWGSPYAGSSKCHVNESCQVSAIIMLEQAGTCSIQKLTTAEAFRAVWSGLTMYSWDKWFVEKVFDLTMALIKTVPVFKFSCTPDTYALEFLEQELRKEMCQ